MRHVKAAELNQVTGMLCFAARIISGATLFMRAMWEQLSVAFMIHRPTGSAMGTVRWEAQEVALNPRIFEEAAWWRRFANQRNQFPMTQGEPLALSIGIARLSDASHLGGGSVPGLRPLHMHRRSLA